MSSPTPFEFSDFLAAIAAAGGAVAGAFGVLWKAYRDRGREVLSLTREAVGALHDASAALALNTAAQKETNERLERIERRLETLCRHRP